MDRDIPETVKARQKNKGMLLIGAGIGILLLVTVLLRAGLRTSLKKSSLTVAVVERGDIENTLSATGEVFPEFEEVITSPINASIRKVSLDAGSEVKAC